MSPTGLFFIAVVVVLSGLLAYWGDLIGRHFGKKRKTIGRLRPRHTAALFTALFGMIASLVTIGLLILFSTPVRVMILEGDRMRSQLVALNKKLETADDSVRQSEVELEKTRSEVKVEQGRVKAEQAKLRKSQLNIAELKKASTALTEQAKRVRTDLSNVRRSLSSLKHEFDRVRAEYRSVDARRSYAVNELNEIKRENLRLDQEVLRQNTELKRLEKDRNELKKDLETLQSDFNTSKSQLDLVRGDLKEVQGNYEQAKADLEQARAELQSVKTSAEELVRRTAFIPRTQRLIFDRGDELARIQVGGRLTLAEARNYVIAILKDASDTALQRGAEPTTRGGPAAVLGDVIGPGGKPRTDKEKIDDKTAELAGKDRNQVILANSWFNAFLGEPVLIQLTVKNNPIVYRSGQVVIETRFDGQKSEEQIVKALTEFLNANIAAKAVRDGMIPAVGTSLPLGTFESDATLALVREIKAVNRVIRVQFLASQETRAADRLKLEFRLR
ncbi:MAG: DUF3084 domain-containing protein [Armatimonadetes bacterium]|nr:DUF3084 domain-containing protein [Armatimonadota bacterium]